jgi:hypothetical protein
MIQNRKTIWIFSTHYLPSSASTFCWNYLLHSIGYTW